MLLPILFLCMKGTAHTRTLVLLPVLCPLLPTYLVSGEHQEQREQTARCIYRLLFSPKHSSGFLRASSFPALFLSLSCCLWTGERMTPNLLFLVSWLALWISQITRRKLCHLARLCSSQLLAYCFFGHGAQMKRDFHFRICRKTVIQNLHTSSGKGELITRRTHIFSGGFFSPFLTFCHFGYTLFL